MSDIILRMEGITKQFGSNVANNSVNFDVYKGEVHTLLGENGAGKSTLMKVLYGIHQPDEGKIYVDGAEVTINSPREAVNYGIGMVHQHFMLASNLTALENIVLGMPTSRPPFLELNEAKVELGKIAAEYDLHVDLTIPVWQLPVGAQQRVEILKVLFRKANILILDEPTAVLTPPEVEQLYKVIDQLKAQGKSVIFISHKLNEVKKVSDRITVLRHGQVTGTISSKEANPNNLAKMMVGRAISLARKQPAVTDASSDKVLEIKDVTCLGDKGVTALNNISLEVRRGEILGVAGVDGNGQRELAECIAGIRPVTEGSISINGQTVTGVVKDPRIMGYIPEDRRRTGLVLDFSIAENLVLKTISEPQYKKFGYFINWGTVYKHARQAIKEFDIRTSGPEAPARHLSGGNQQRVVLSRELEKKPAFILASQATRGLDVGAIENVQDLLREQRNQGAAILYISTELTEVMSISDRIIVMSKGEIMGEVTPDPSNLPQIGEMMMGLRTSEQEGRANNEQLES
ncbi:MAG: ABC transporter ATP-binding protein [Firmicutes bacterium]|nr:ABC transporter ATP-binding protein [Bacillota bacterium]